MTYKIGYSAQRKGGKVSEATVSSAKRAFRLVCELQASDEMIRYIKAPWGGAIGVGELEMYAEKEAEPLG
jgi:hypothetical protein